MRFIMALLLCLSISLQGWAAGTVAPAPAPCPMEGMHSMQADNMQASGAGEEERMADSEDCCNDAVTAALTGKLCKTGQECQAPTGLLMPFSQPIVQAQPSSVLLVAGSPTPPDGPPVSVWRPPSL